MKRALVALLLAHVPFALACAAETASTPPQVDAGPPDRDGAPIVCRELGDRIATEIERRCNFDKQKNYDDFVAQAKCDDVTNIRDLKELRENCYPDLKKDNVTCSALRGGAIPPSCRAQLIRPR